MEQKKVTAWYQFQTASNLIKVQKTWDKLYDIDDQDSLKKNKIETDSVELTHEDILRKFSDKRIKKTHKKVEQKKGRKSGTTTASRYRYILPLLFLSPEGKTVIRKCKVLNLKEDKKYDSLSRFQWEKQYNEMIPFTIMECEGNLQFKTNPSFCVQQFIVCGGIINSKFWDINLRYAQLNHYDNDELYSLTISKISQFLQEMPKEQTRLPRHMEESKETKEASD